MSRWEDYVFDGDMTDNWPKKRVPKQDLSGRSYSNWTIISPINISKDEYVVKCSCGREYRRSCRGIISGRSSACYICYKKSKAFNRMRIKNPNAL